MTTTASRPGGPTHPAPSGPPRPTPNGPAPHPLPRLGEIIRDAERTLTQAINVLGRQYDPTSAPEHDPRDPFPSEADIRLGQAAGNVRAALCELEGLVALGLPPVGSAISVPRPARGDHFEWPGTREIAAQINAAVARG